MREFIMYSKKMNAKLILFDIDDTLLYTSKNAYKKHCLICEKCWVPLTDYDLYFSYYWKKSITEMASILIPEISSDLYMKYYKEAWEVVPYDAIYDNIKTIFNSLNDKWYLIGILTNWNEEKTTKKLDFLWIKDDCSLIFHWDNMQYKKPSPKVFEGVKGKFKEIIFIGDSLEDYYSARDAVICFYAMLTWFTKFDDFINAWLNSKFIYKDVISLLDNL